jgi:Ankyrin repeats (many copies)
MSRASANLLDLGVSTTALYRAGDGYFGIAKDSTALHVAAWRACPEVVRELIARGAPVNAADGYGRTALQLAVKACVDSYWTERRSPDSIRALLEAGASTAGIKLPTGYEEADELLRRRLDSWGSSPADPGRHTLAELRLLTRAARNRYSGAIAAIISWRAQGRAKTKILLALLGCSSGASVFSPELTSELPVLTATYCFPLTE